MTDTDAEDRSGEAGETEADGASSAGGTGRAGSEESSRSQRFGDGIKQGIGVLSAFKDALEETIQEARDRGDLSAERAKDVVKEALDRAQTAAEGARERLDFVPQSQVDGLSGALEALRDRVAELERAVFGAASQEEAPPVDGADAAGSSEGDDVQATDSGGEGKEGG
jgi:polyhydroxyalkanoate synthesis regulator phasin